MAFESFLRDDLLSSALLENPEKITVIAETQFVNIVNLSHRGTDRTTTPHPAKNIIETMELIRQAILDYEGRVHATQDSKVDVVYEKPDKDMNLETISISFTSRAPGAYSQGAPLRGDVKNRKPLLRELIEDPDNPGYKMAVLGFFYDNVLTLTAWARTNKQANERALWIENLMEEYAWFFVHSGVNRILFNGWRKNEVLEINGNKYYGRPIDYFVRTERLWNLSQKKLEEIILRFAIISQ